MDKTGLTESIANLVFTKLVLDCPVLSGNMQQHITFDSYTAHEYKMSVSAISYDTNLWKKTGQIKLNHKYQYAAAVNKLGAFGGRSTKSKGWVDKSIYNTLNIIKGTNPNIEIDWRVND